MARTALKERLFESVFFVDGAMGTQLIEAGSPVGRCHELLNIEHADIVKTVHQKYIDAGVDAVITNTFGGNRLRLKRHGLEDRAAELNIAAAKLAREAAGEERYVLGDIGPCGDFLEPLGAVKEVNLKAAFAEQAQALFSGGVDGFVIETMTALEEIKVAVEAIQIVSDLPIWVSLSYDPAAGAARTMMGISPEQAVRELADLGITAIGFNCGTLDMDGYIALAKAYESALDGTGVLLLAEPNAGRPQIEDDKISYNLSPDEYAEAMLKIKAAGASILGGCCGTTPAHLAAAVAKCR